MKFERIQFITDNSNADELFSKVRSALIHGVRWIQYRNKTSADDIKLIEALQLKKICDEFSATLIINDSIELCMESRAHGVHLGKNDMKISEARKILGNEFIIGGSTNSFEDVLQCVHEGADYAGIGPFRFTATKNNLNPILGRAGFEKIMTAYKERNLSLPLFAIGGVMESDVGFFINLGIYGVAVSSMIASSNNISSSVKSLKEKFQTQII
mgnify:CR=1 FL=1